MLLKRPRAAAGGAAVLVGLVLLLVQAASPFAAWAQDDPDAGAVTEGAGDITHVAQPRPDVVDVVEVSGYLDGIVADYIERSIRNAAERDSLALVLQVNSSRSVVSDERVARLAEAIRASEVPVSMWVGPSGSVAKDGIGQLAGVVTDLALAPGSRIGDLGELAFDERYLHDEFAAAYPRLANGTFSFGDSIDAGIAREAPTLPFFVLDLPGFPSRIDTSGEEPVRVPEGTVRFTKLSVLDQFMHAAASPALAYLLFLIGGGLLVFELYTAGVGLIGGIGAICFVFACYGLAALPARGWAVALLVLALFGYAVDIQIGVPRAWTVIATTSLVAGSLTLFEWGVLSWITLGAGIVGTVAGMVSGMPAMVRSRFGTPTIGRDWMIGAVGTAREPVNPEGVVLIDAAPWRARTHRATPIASGDPVRVVALDGLILTVEPATSES